MCYRSGTSALVLAVTSALFLGSADADAATTTWTTVAGGVTAGSGTWSTTNSNWWTGSTTASWAAGNSAVFAGSSGALDAYVISVSGNQSFGTFAFNSNGYVLTSGSETTTSTGVYGTIASGATASIGNGNTMVLNSNSNTGQRVQLLGNGATFNVEQGGTYIKNNAGTGATNGSMGFTGTGTVNVSGSMLYTPLTGGGGIVFSNAAGDNETVNVNAPGVLSSASTTTGIVVANNASTTILNVNGGLVSTTATNAALAALNLTTNNASANGTVNLNGGTISTYQVSKSTGSNGAGTFNFNGGTLAAIANNNSFMTGLTNVNIQGNGAYINPNGFNVTIGQTLLDGGGGLTQVGGGTLNLTANNSYSGPTSVKAGLLIINGSPIGSGSYTVNGGTMLINGSPSGAGNYAVNSGALIVNGNLAGGGSYSVFGSATLGGSGTVTNSNVTLNSGAILAPGNNTTTGSIGTLNLSNLSLGGNGTAYFDLTTTTTPGSGVNDLVAVTGNLTLTGTTAISISTGGASLANGYYTLFTYTGSALTASQSSQFSLGTPGAINPRQRYQFDTSDAGSVLLDITGNPATSNWNAASGSAWTTSTASTNWFNTGTSLSDFFANGDNVNFTSSKTGVVSIVDLVAPGPVTVSGPGYTFASSGSGAITGAGSLTVQSPATLVLATTNGSTYSGGTFLQGGSITLGANNALPTAGTLTMGAFGSSGTLDLGGFNQQLKGLAIDPGATASNQVVNASTGNSTLTFNGGATPSAYAGTIQDVGTLNLTVSAGTLDLTGATTTYHGATTINGNSTLVLANNLLNSTGASVASGASLNLTPTGTMTVASVISGSGAINVNGNGVAILTAANTFTNQANVTAGTLVLANTAAIPAVGVNFGAGTGTVDLATNTSVAPFNLNMGVTAGGQFTDTIIVDRATAGSGILQSAGTLTCGANGTGGNGANSTCTLNVQAGANVTSGGTLALTTVVLNDNPSVVILNPTGAVMQVGSAVGVHSGATLVLGGSTFGNVFTGTYTQAKNADNLTMAGSGSWTITGPAGYTGTTAVSGGTLSFLTANSLAGALAVGNPNPSAPATAVVLNLAATGNSSFGSLSGSIADPFDNNTATINTGNAGTSFIVNQSTTSEFDGAIAGPGNFTLAAASIGALTLGGTNTYTGTTSVLGGNLNVNGELSSPSSPLVVSNSATLTFNNAATVGPLSGVGNGATINTSYGNNFTVNQTVPGVYAGSIAGGGNLVLGSASTSTLTFSGTSSSFFGNVNVNGGNLCVAGNLSAGLVQANSGATLSGNGTIAAPVTIGNGGILTPGVNSSGTMTIASGQLTFGASTGNSAVLNMSIGPNPTSINVTAGGVTVNGGPSSVAVNVNYPSAPAVGIYKLISYASGTISPTDSAAFTLNISDRVSANLLDDIAGQSLDLNVTAFRFPVWSGSSSLNWNTSDTNWVLSSDTSSVNTSTQTQFRPGDFVEFSDYSSPSKTSITITGSNVSPNGVLFNNNTNNYTLVSGLGIAGAGSLIKTGSGSLTIATANTYTAGTVLSGGVLNVNNATALGTGTLTINGGKLDNTSGGLAMTANNPQSWNGNFEFIGTQNLSMGTGGVAINPSSGSSVTVTVDHSTFGVGPIASTTAGLTKAGPGTLAITSGGGQPAFDSVIGGPLNVAAGTLQINTGSTAGTTADFIAAGLTGGGTVVNDGGAARWLLINSSESDAFSGTLANGAGGGNLGLEPSPLAAYIPMPRSARRITGRKPMRRPSYRATSMPVSCRLARSATPAL
jgi:autotransporter-associated beta strand protein